MNIVLLPPADVELEEAVIYYNDQMSGLGDQFYQKFSDSNLLHCSGT